MVTESRKKGGQEKEARTAARQKIQKKESGRLIKDSRTDPKARDYLKRRSDIIPPLKTFLVVCEGEKTEPGYFESLRATWKIPVTVEILKGRGNTLSVVQEAVNRRRESGASAYDEVWAVFDRDDFSPDRIRAAFDLAERAAVRIAFSNEAFELWYILHYEARSTGLNRREYQRRLTGYLKKKYEKNSPGMFERLRGLLPGAVRNAMRLADDRPMYDRALVGANPYTGVHLLIKALLPDKKFMRRYANMTNMTSDEYKEVAAAFQGCALVEKSY